MSAREGRSQAWIAAKEASHRIAARFGGLTRAQHALALGLREGLLDAAAESADVTLGYDDEFIEEQAPQGELLGIDPEHWTRSEIWESDRLRWDWAAGDFEIHNIETGETYLFSGVHFLEGQVEALDPTSPAFGSLPPKTPQEPAGASTTAIGT